MRRTMTGLFAAALALGLFIAAPGFAHHPGDHPQGKHGFDDVIEHDCSNADGEVIYGGPIEMWPPNHKYRGLTVTAIADDEEAEVTLDTAGTHDEYADTTNNSGEMNGAGNTADDIDPPDDADTSTASGTPGSATTAHQVRAERSGRGDGRTYTISAVALFDGEPCETDGPVEFTIDVPHSQGQSAANKKVHEP